MAGPTGGPTGGPTSTTPTKPLDQMSDLEKEELRKKNEEKDEQAKRDKAARSGQLDAGSFYNRTHGWISWRRIDADDPDFDPKAPGLFSRQTKLLPDGTYEFRQMQPHAKDKEVSIVGVSKGFISTVPKLDLDNKAKARVAIRKQLHFIGGQGQTLFINFGHDDQKATINWEYERINDPVFVEKCKWAFLEYIKQCKELGIPYEFGKNAESLMKFAFSEQEIKQIEGEKVIRAGDAEVTAKIAMEKVFDIHKADIMKLSSVTADPNIALVDTAGKALADDAKLDEIEKHLSEIGKQLVAIEQLRKLLESNADAFEKILDDPAHYGLSASQVEGLFNQAATNRVALIGELERKRNELGAQLAIWEAELNKIPVPAAPAAVAGAPPPPPPPMVARLDDLKDRRKKLADGCVADQAAEKNIQAKLDKVPDLIQQAKLKPII